jgi:hypothetical protein
MSCIVVKLQQINQLNASDVNFFKELNAGSYESLVWPIIISTVFSMKYFQHVMAYFQEEEKKIYWIIVDHSIIILNSDLPGLEAYRQWVIHWYWGGGGGRVFNSAFNNISAISWQSFLLVEETGVQGEDHCPAAVHWQTFSYNMHLLRGVRTHSVSGDR